MKIVIPARRDSKGLPFKNRRLFGYTIDSIPEPLAEEVYVSSNDVVLEENCKKVGVNFVRREEELSQDTTCVLDVMKDVVERCEFKQDEVIAMLYLTYPDRKWEHVMDAYRFFAEHDANSLLCKKSLKVSPYLCMLEDGLGGKQLIPHDLYRRQDYPECFEISHYICIFRVSELNNLNKNMYNSDTIFYGIDEVVDVDTLRDLQDFYDKDHR